MWGVVPFFAGLNSLESDAQSCTPINLGPDFSYACAQSCTTLNANPLRQLATTAYTVTAASYTPYPFNAGTSVSYSNADQWSGSVALPFPFCFMGTTYTSLVIGENGVLSFDASVAGQTCNWQQQSIPFAGNTQPNNVPFPHAAIFAAYQDLDILAGGTIRYQVQGSFPCRRFVVSYNNVPHYNCPGLTSTFQVVLHELSNQVDVYIQQKSSCGSWQGGNAVEGILDMTGTNSYAVTGRNASVWAVVNDAYSFVPSGAPIYTIQWKELGGPVLAATGDTAQVCNLGTTTYVATIQYACVPVPVSFSDTITVSRPPLPHVVLSNTTPPSCNGGSNGSIQVSGAGGLPAYQYRLASGSYQVSGLFTGLGAGSYVIGVKDANGCQKDTTILLGQPPAIQATVNIQPTACSGVSVVTLQATGGQPAYTYALDAGGYQASAAFSGVVPGAHTFHIKDINGCVGDVVVTVPALNTLVAQVAVTDPLCAGGQGQVSVSATGGQPAYQYAMDGGAFQSGNTFATGVGTHTFSVKDASGCTDDSVVNIVAPAPIGVTATVVNPACAQAYGTITLYASGGTPPYTYGVASNAYSGSNLFTGTPPGSYVFHVKDANGCIKDTLLTVVSQTPVIVHAVITPAGCNNNQGSIVSTPFGGQAPYTFNLSGTAGYQASGTYTGLGAGTYILSVKDANDCLKDTTIIIPMSPTLAVNANAISISCFGLADGSFTLSASGGTAPYQFSVNGSAYSNTTVYPNQPAGVYNVTVKDQQGCEEGASVQVPGPSAPLKPVVNLSGFACNGATGTLTVTATGGMAPYTYALGTSLYGPVGVFTSLSAGTYTVHVKDAANCVKDSVVQINTPPVLVITGLQITPVACYGGQATVQVQASGGTPPYAYAYNTAIYNSSNVLSIPAGSQVVHVRDANQCVKDTVINLVQPASSGIAVSYPAIACAGGTTTITVQGSGSNPFTYALNNGAFTATNTFAGQTAGGYTLHVKDAQQCVRDTSFIIGQPAAVVMGMAITPVHCSGDSAVVTLSGSGGSGGYSYALFPGGYSAVNTFKVPAGTYTFSLRDNTHCQKDTVITLVNGVNIAATYNIVPVLCNGNNNGSITVFPSVGAAPFEYAVNNGAFSSNNNFTSLPLGTYTIKIKDALGCRKDTAIQLIPISDINIGVQVSPPACFGQANGAVTINIISGGKSPYQSAIGAGTYSSTFTYPGLAPGTYVFHIRDSIKCIKDTTIVITQPAQLATIVQVVNVGCNGNNNGSLQVFASGGTAPYQYALNAGSFGLANVFSGLVAGSYTLHVKDSRNCLKDTVVAIIQPPAMRLDSLKVVPLTCSGAANASVTVYGSGGVPPYQYAADGGLYGSSPVFNGLAAGPHQFAVKDNGGCTKDTFITIAQPVPVQVAVPTVVHVLCNGGASGSVTLAGSGGAAPYQYAVNTGAYGSSAVFNGLSAGSYVFHVKDAGGCIKDTTVAISQPVVISWQAVSVTPVGCAGQANGSIVLAATGGAGTFQYALGSGNYGAAGSFTGLATGTYTLHAKDANGCIKDTVLTITQPLPLQVSLVLTPVSCTGNQTDGGITVNASGGTTPYQYALNTGSFGPSGVFAGLSAGSYTVHLTDTRNCTKDTTVQLLVPAAPRIDSLQITGIPCAGQASGSVRLFGSGGVAPYTYSKNGGGFGSNALFGSLAAGSYTFSIKGANGCIKDTSMVLLQPVVLGVASVQLTPVTCRNATNGSVQLNGQGGTAPYTYALGSSVYSAINSFGNLAAGTYTLHVKDANNCVKDTTVIITAPPAIVIQSVAVGQVLCAGAYTGSLQITASGGTGSLQYAINNNTYISGNAFSGLPAAVYTIHVKDANGCIKDTVVSITQPALLATALVIQPVTCTGSLTDGGITVSPSGGVVPYSYAINSGSFGSVNQFNGLVAGTYQVKIRDANGCEKDTQVVLSAPADIALAALVTAVTCYQGNDASISLEVAGGTGPFTYVLSAGQNFGPTANASHVFTGLGTQASIVARVTDQNGCTADTTLAIKGPGVVLLAADHTDIACHNQTTGQIVVHAAGGNGGFRYSLTGNDYQADSVFTSLGGGQYTVYVQDAKGCGLSLPITLAAPRNPLAIQLEVDSVLCTGLGNDGAAAAIITGGTTPYAYGWSTGETVLKINNLKEGQYIFYVTDANGCKDTALAQVGSRGCCTIYVPNAFTPNHDQTNDWFRVVNAGRLYEFEMMVYNRLGQQVFISIDPQKGWDGTFGNEPAEVGTYYYMIHYRCEVDNQKKFVKGDVILLR
jgi:gliding motility-associated-like protein